MNFNHFNFQPDFSFFSSKKQVGVPVCRWILSNQYAATLTHLITAWIFSPSNPDSEAVAEYDVLLINEI